MKNTRHTLIVDGNFFFFRTLHVLPKSKSKNKPILGTDKDVAIYVRKLATDFAYQLRLFEGLIGSVIWTIDSKSWRKTVFPSADYKGNRKASNDIDWDNFRKATDDFVDLIKKKGVIISKEDGAEGDDLMYAWQKKSKQPSIMLTGDRDLVQLVNNNSNNLYSLLYSPINQKLYTYQGFNDWLNDEDSTVSNSNDLFEIIKTNSSAENRTKNLFNKLLESNKFELEEVDTAEFSFCKVLTGDSGDNVMSAYWYTKDTKTGKTRTYKVSDKKAKKIVDEYKAHYGGLNFLDLFDDEKLITLRNILVRVMKAKSERMPPEQILINIKNNINLMILNRRTIPDNVLNDMFNSIENSISDSQKIILKELNSMNLILEGTEYKKDKIEVSSSLLDDDDDDDDFSFITDRKKTNKVF